MNINIDKNRIGSKDIYVFEDHATALIPWGEIRNRLDCPPNLLTLDHHTDTYPAFLRHIYGLKGGDDELIRKKLIQKIDIKNDGSLKKAVSQLHHDEHIDAAVRSNIIQYAHCIQYSDNEGTMSFEDHHDNGIFIVPHECAIGCIRMPHNDQCRADHYNQAIESIYLDDQLRKANMISIPVGISNIEDVPYILDIDLDYFHSRRSINPDSSETFYRLISNALAVTIAKEPSCVDDGKLEGEDIDSTYLLKRLLEHIENALST